MNLRRRIPVHVGHPLDQPVRVIFRGGRGNVDTNIALYVLGRVALCTKDYTSARTWLEEDIALWHATGDIRCAPGALLGWRFLRRRRRRLRRPLTFSDSSSGSTGLSLSMAAWFRGANWQHLRPRVGRDRSDPVPGRRHGLRRAERSGTGLR